MRTLLSRYRYLALISTILVFTLIILGGIVRFSQPEKSCPDWPTCFGQWTPPNGILTPGLLLDYLHRFTSLLAGIPIAIGSLLAFRFFRKDKLIFLLQISATILFLVQIFSGGGLTRASNSGVYPWISAIHLGLSLWVLGFNVLLVTLLFYRLEEKFQSGKLRFESQYARISLLVAGSIFTLLVSGAIVAQSGARFECNGWPLCTPDNPIGWLNLGHRILVGLTGLLVIFWLWQAWRTQRTQTPILVSSTATAVLFFAQALLGSKLVHDYPGYMLVLHQATSFAMWISMIVHLVTVGMAGRTALEESIDITSGVNRQVSIVLKDFLMLTKPVVVTLLLVTTFAGMVIGARQWPSFSLMFWTLLGGFMAAGGSGAVNQYIDRYDDEKMKRTQKRPIPAGRMTPAEGLAFGVGLLLASFYLMVAFVNLLAALLSLAGMVYYVLIYSIYLKKTTVQNIVIGGGAGAIPPLVGWAAATGYLNIPALFLFAVIFMWTPPHFWALALVRKNDYARAGVPMLPVIRGDHETRWQILIYTIELVVLTLVLPMFGLGGNVYLAGAVILGVWLLYAAWQVWKLGGNKLAWKMYRYSSMYLAFIFFVLMVDRLL